LGNAVVGLALETRGEKMFGDVKIFTNFFIIFLNKTVKGLFARSLQLGIFRERVRDRERDKDRERERQRQTETDRD